MQGVCYLLGLQFKNVKITCVEEPKWLWLFSEKGNTIILSNMRNSIKPISHLTPYETYAYQYLDPEWKTMNNLLTFDLAYLRLAEDDF